jgi:hypothetical protein
MIIKTKRLPHLNVNYGDLKDIVYFEKHDAYDQNMHMYIEATTLPQHVNIVSPYEHCLSWKTRPR